MRLSILWRIMEIKEGVIHRGCRPRRITPSEISIILHMIRKPNSIIVSLFIQNNSKFKNIAKICLPPWMLSSSSIGLFSSANILQIADASLWVVFLLFLPCFWLLFCLVLTLKRSEMSAIFLSQPKQLNLVPRSSLVKHIMVNYACAFSQSELGEYFEWIINLFT